MIQFVKIINWFYLLLILLMSALLFTAQRAMFDGKIVLYLIPFFLAILAFRLDSNAKTRWVAFAVNAITAAICLFAIPTFLFADVPVLLVLIPLFFFIPTGINCYYIYRRHIKMKLMLASEASAAESTPE